MLGVNYRVLVGAEKRIMPKRECVHAKSIQLYPTMCDPVDCSLPSSSVHGILQTKILEWVAMPSSKGSSQHRD